MEVVILCGGEGTRLREETEYRPKPMVQIGSHPILWHIMNIFANFNHTDFCLALGYKGTVIKEFFKDYEFMSNDFKLELGSPEKTVIYDDHDQKGWNVTLSAT